MSFLKSLAYPWQAYRHHLACQMLPFYPIQDDLASLKAVQSRKYRYHSLLPFTIIAILGLDTCILYFQEGNDPINMKFYHHAFAEFMPKFFLKQDIAFGGFYALTLIPLLLLFLDRFPHRNFILLQTGNALTFPFRDQRIPRSLGEKLVKFHEASRKQISRMVTLMTYQCHLGFGFPFVVYEFYKVISSDFRYLPNARMTIFMIICPFGFRWLCSSIQIGLQFLNQNVIINIKQRFWISRLTSGSWNVRNIRRKFQSCRTSMRNILDIAQETQVYSRFYEHYISAIIVIYGAEICSALNASLTKGKDAPLLQVLPWYFFSSLYVLCIVSFNSASSVTIFLNFRLFKSLRQLQMRLLASKKLVRREVVKLDLVNEYKMLLMKCCFRASNSAPINNKLFVFTIFGSVSLFYLKLKEDERPIRK